MFKQLLIAITLLVCASSCQEKETLLTMGETEYYFDEKLSSINTDSSGSLWLGTETGEIINVRSNQNSFFDLNEDRIYKILFTNNDSVAWVAVRNSGLQKWERVADRFEKKRVYEIDFKGKYYSPYDLTVLNNNIYVATTQGLYTLDLSDTTINKLSLIYPSSDFLSKKHGTPFIMHNLVSYHDSLIIASTQNGILKYNLRNKEISFASEDKYIEHVSIYNDTLFALSSDRLMLRKPTGEYLSDIDIAFNAKVYYQAQGIHYLLGKDGLLLSDDLSEFYHFLARRPIPTNGRNLVASDSLNIFTYLLTEKALWRTSNNINIFKSNKSIKASCSNSKSIFYLSNKNELYMQNIGSNVAKWIYTFPSENQIQWIDIVGNDLYLYNLDNEYQKITISDNWIKNLLFKTPQTLFKSKAKITTARLKNINNETLIYLGVQDGAIVVNQKGEIDSIPAFGDKYITSMFGHKRSDKLYVSSLNDGVYYVNFCNNVVQIPNTNNVSFINDIIATDDHSSNLIILTNKQIISLESNDSIKAKGYKKLIYANDTLFYALPEFGLHKFQIQNNRLIDKGVFYPDIRFDINSSFVIDSELVLVSNVGALNIHINDESNGDWITFEEAKNINLFTVFQLFILILLIIFIICLIRKKKSQLHINKVLNNIDSLLSRLNEIKNYYSLLKDFDNEGINRIIDRLYTIDPKLEDANKLALELDKYSFQIAKLNRKIALRMHYELENQIDMLSQIDAFDKELLLNKSREVVGSEDVEIIKDQIENNTQWLTRRIILLELIDVNKEKLHKCVEIEGVSKGLYIDILNLEKQVLHKPLEEINDLYNQFEKQIQVIYSESALDIIVQHIHSMELYFNQKIESDKGLVFLMLELQSIKNEVGKLDNLLLLQNLNRINNKYLLLQNLDDLKFTTSRYKEISDIIISENNKLINKKQERELSLYIGEKTADLTKQINFLISNLYSLLQVSDKYIISDILKLSNTDGQYAKILALLICNMKIKRTLIPGMLGVYGNLNPVVSRLINERIRPNEEKLREIQKISDFKNLFVYLLLKLIQ